MMIQADRELEARIAELEAELADDTAKFRNRLVTLQGDNIRMESRVAELEQERDALAQKVRDLGGNS